MRSPLSLVHNNTISLSVKKFPLATSPTKFVVWAIQPAAPGSFAPARVRRPGENPVARKPRHSRYASQIFRNRGIGGD